MEIKELDKQISGNSLDRLYFFCGEETFLMENKLASIKKKLISDGADELDYMKLEGKKTTAEAVISALRSVPIMSERLLVVVKNSGLFANSSTKSYAALCDELKELPDYVCAIFCESEFDKKKEKNLAVFGKSVVKFDFLSPKQLELWLEKLFEGHGKQILSRELSEIISRTSCSMANIFGEYQKLLAFVGDREKITADDVDRVVSKTIDARIFEVIDSIALGKGSKAFEELKALSDLGENPSVIMSLLSGRMSELLMVKHLVAERTDSKKIAEYFEPRRPPFVINKYTEQCRAFSEKYLKRMTLKGLEYTAAVREGHLDKWAAVEMYTAELIKK